MKKIKKILQLSDPYPNFGYEIACYLKTVLGFVLIILGLFLILSPLLKRNPVILGFAVMLGPLGENILAWEREIFGQNFGAFSFVLGILFVLAGAWSFWKIKLVRKFISELR